MKLGWVGLGRRDHVEAGLVERRSPASSDLAESAPAPVPPMMKNSGAFGRFCLSTT